MPTTFSNSPPTVDVFTSGVAGQALNNPSITTVVNNHSAAIVAIEHNILDLGIYVPAKRGNGLTTFTSTWAGAYTNHGPVGVLSLGCAVTANWAGSGYIACDLPAGWTASGVESFMTGHAFPMPNPYGLHYPVHGVVHAGLTEVRFTAPTVVATVAQGGAPGFMTATAATDLFTSGGLHGLVAGDAVFVSAAAAALPAGVTIRSYYVIATGLTTSACKLSTTVGGTAVDVTADGSVMVAKQVPTTARGSADSVVDGVIVPFAFTGDATVGNQDLMYVSGVVFKNP